MLYESLLLLGVLAFAFVLPQLVFGMTFGQLPPAWILLMHVFLVLLAYFFCFWRQSGQTLAMKTWKLRIVTASLGSAPSNRQLFLRYCLCWPCVLFYGVGLVWALFDRDRQFLQDRLAGTRLIEVP